MLAYMPNSSSSNMHGSTADPGWGTVRHGRGVASGTLTRFHNMNRWSYHRSGMARFTA